MAEVEIYIVGDNMTYYLDVRFVDVMCMRICALVYGTSYRDSGVLSASDCLCASHAPGSFGAWRA